MIFKMITFRLDKSTSVRSSSTTKAGCKGFQLNSYFLGLDKYTKPKICYFVSIKGKQIPCHQNFYQEEGTLLYLLFSIRNTKRETQKCKQILFIKFAENIFI